MIIKSSKVEKIDRLTKKEKKKLAETWDRSSARRGEREGGGEISFFCSRDHASAG